MKRILRGVRHGEKGFTLIELLIVIAILGILAAVVVPNLAGFIGAGNAAAANQEVANIETSAMAYYAEHGDWPTDSGTLVTDGYISATPQYYVYSFDAYGKVDTADGEDSLIGALTWNATGHVWER
jgi:type IV pilus assembly protein PilA